MNSQHKFKVPPLVLNILLFLLTVLTTTAAGALQQGVPLLALFKNGTLIFRGISFSFTLLAILIAHEMSHYFVSRYHGVEVTLPYFIPAPSVIGTFGAFIKIKSPMRDRRSLLDIGLAGPLGGTIVAIPVLLIGLKLSTVQVMPKVTGAVLGSSLLLNFMIRITLGNLPEYYQVVLHPVAFAGWIGLLVTSLNLIPVGQLDGGHIMYAILGERSKKLAYACIAILLLLARFGWPGGDVWAALLKRPLDIMTILSRGGWPAWPGWYVWALLLYVMGLKHPPPLNPHVLLDTKRKLLGALALALFVVTFTPVPFTIF